jgi:hypothetical protein
MREGRKSLPHVRGAQHEPAKVSTKNQPRKPAAPSPKAVVQPKALARTPAQPQAPPAYRSPTAQKVLQAKQRAAPPAPRNQPRPPPAAPPAYRPQPSPKVLQAKTATPPPVNQAHRTPAVPPVYRPQSPPRVLQPKQAVARQPRADQPCRQPVAPPVYRPEAGKIVQPKAGVVTQPRAQAARQNHGNVRPSVQAARLPAHVGPGTPRKASATGPNIVQRRAAPGAKPFPRSPRLAVVQLTRKSKGIEYAVDEDDALKWLAKNVSDFYSYPEEDREVAISIAQKKTDGVDQAKNTLGGGEYDKIAKARTKEREATIKDDYDTYSGVFTDDLANTVFEVMKSGYVSGNMNVSVGGTRTQQQVDDAITAFRVLVARGTDLADNIKNFHWFRRQDKSALGKGNVGATLDTRGVQANFIATWGGRIINAHVDISD